MPKDAFVLIAKLLLVKGTRDAEFCFIQLWSIVMPAAWYFKEIIIEVQKKNYLENKVLVSMETAAKLDLF